MQNSKQFCQYKILNFPVKSVCIAVFFFFWLFGSYATSAYADTTADSPVLLTIHRTTSDSSTDVIELDLNMLTSMEATSIIATVPWLEPSTQFKGVRINTLLKSIGATSTQFEAIAINDYKFTLSDIDFDKYPIIIAYEKNGQLLNVRNLGPLLIMFPFDDFPELVTERNKAASVWQLIEMRLH